VKDLQDYDGDRIGGCRTVAVAWGIEEGKSSAHWIALVAAFVTIILTKSQSGNVYFMGVMLIFNLFPLLYLIRLLNAAVSSTDFKKINYLSLYYIVSGVLTMLLYRF
jgi:4-hydroxybenzoate polyprenyltransferase